MGACFESVVIKGENETEAKKKFEAIQENDRYENGHSYSGTIGMADGIKFTGQSFASRNEAEEYLVNTCQKWEEALAVKFKNQKGEINFLVGAWCSS